MIQFESLSFDVLLTILNLLGPLDILRLRKTCHTLHSTTLERVVWINALHRACVRNSIFMPTFPIDDMSQSALEYAATGPDRFLRAVANGRLPEPRSHRLIQRKDEEFLEIFIVPGGRYLVTIDSAVVAVWDLGIPGSSTQCSELMSTAPTRPGFTLLLIHPTDDGRGITIFVNYDSDGIICFNIFRIYPSDELPSLQQIGQLEIPYPPDTPLCICSTSKNKIIYLMGPTLNVWDYAENSWASIQVPDDYREVMVLESAILVPYPDVVLIWNMPPLCTSRPLFSDSPANTPPSFSLKIPNSQTIDYCRGPCNWYSGSPQPLLFDNVTALEFQRFEIVHKNADFSDSVVTTLGTYLDPNEQGMEYGRFCNDALVCLWTVPGGATVAHVAGGSIESIFRTLELHDGRVTHYPCSLCPLSGRFVCTEKLDCVKIVDYFPELSPMSGFPNLQNQVPSSSDQ